MRRRMAWQVLGWAMAGWAAVAAAGRTNLVANGSFEDPTDPLRGWRTEYHLPGESWYADNRELVSVVPVEGSREKALRLHVKTKDLALNQGVKADSEPIPIDPGLRYRFSASARSTGPNARILLEGYRWAPGVKPHDKPHISELRKCYKFTQLYFGPQKAGDMGGVGRSWSIASMEFPDAMKSDLQREIYSTIRFVVVHVVAIGGEPGELLVDNISVEPLGPVKERGASRR